MQPKGRPGRMVGNRKRGDKVNMEGLEARV